MHCLGILRNAWLFSSVRHFSTFLISSRLPSYSGAFFRVDYRGIVYFPKKNCFDAPEGIKILHLLRELKNIFFPFNLGSVRCALMRGIQIWFHN